MLTGVAFGCAFHELQEMSQVFPFGDFEFGELYPDPKRWTALSHDPGENKSFDPDLPIGQPETDFDGHPRGYGRGGLNEASAHAGV